MKVISSDGKITVFTQSVNDANINDYIKKIIIKLKRKYRISVCGFYQINVYKNSVVGMIIDIIKEDGIDYFNDLVDLKIKVYDDCDIYFSFDDYFFNNKRNFKIFNNKYYININDLSQKDFLLMTEFCNYVYGEKLEKIENNLLTCNNLTN